MGCATLIMGYIHFRCTHTYVMFTTQVFSFLNVDILKNKYKQFNTSTIKTTTVLKYCKSASHTVIFNNYRHQI
jgi:hypothetical protein